MANKFTQSVMERLEKEALLQQKNTPKTQGALSEAPGASCTAPEIPTGVNSTIQNNTPSAATQGPVSTISLDNCLRTAPARVAKNKTFYLDQSVINALHQAARARGVTDSQLVNAILIHVFGLADGA